MMVSLLFWRIKWQKMDLNGLSYMQQSPQRSSRTFFWSGERFVTTVFGAFATLGVPLTCNNNTSTLHICSVSEEAAHGEAQFSVTQFSPSISMLLTAPLIGPFKDLPCGLSCTGISISHQIQVLTVLPLKNKFIGWDLGAWSRSSAPREHTGAI